MKESEPFLYYVNQCVNVSKNILQLFIYPSDEKKLEFLAGQYLELLYPDGTYQPFSIANAPHDDGRIELHIRHLPNDQLTNQLVNEIKQLRTIRIRGPFGKNIYHNKRPTLLLAAGTGFAHAKAIIEQYILAKKTFPMHLYWGVKTAADFYLPKLPEYWLHHLPHFQYTPMISQPSLDLTWSGKTGYTHQAAIADHPDLTHFQVYVSGPPQMVSSAWALFQQHGLQQRYFYSDLPI